MEKSNHFTGGSESKNVSGEKSILAWKYARFLLHSLQITYLGNMFFYNIKKNTF